MPSSTPSDTLARPAGSTNLIQNIRLIATDLDGTLIGSVNEFPLYKNFRDRINELRRENNAVWVACTGRNMRSFWDFFSPMRSMSILPDYIVLRHAYIYELSRIGYVPHIFWNLHIRYLLWRNELYVHDAIREWHATILESSADVKTVVRRRNRLVLRFLSEQSASAAFEILQDLVKPYKHMRVFRYQKEVDVRAVPFTKGLALAELTRHLGIQPDSVLVIGNGHNDISMMEPEVARYVGCPSNSEAEVVRYVHERGGHIANERCLGGVLEILQAYQDGQIRSQLPEWWRPPEETLNPNSARMPRRHGAMPRPSRWLVLGAIYVVLLALASFDLVPFSRPIRWPLEKIMDLLNLLVERLWTMRH
ncbi:MAG: HAD family hydrolase [Kiritimatiellae bacterium]|nr:HAD family hydrolase [Kiritimatiellia bacterium]